MAEEQEHWRQFQGTELGALMSQIYGNQNKPKINYPKPTKSTKPLLPDKQFMVGGNVHASDPRKATRRPVNIAVPKHVPQKREITAIDVVSRRRNADSIKQEIDDIKMKQTHYRPAYQAPYSSDVEKDKLSQIFTYKGGKGLPEEMTQIAGEAPFEAEQRRKEEQRLEAIRMKRSGAVARHQPAKMSEDELIMQQITQELDERRQHLEDMKEIGISKQEESRLRTEIARKLEELRRYESK